MLIKISHNQSCYTLSKQVAPDTFTEQLENAIHVVDEYLTQDGENSLFLEPTHKGDQIKFKKWEQLAKVNSQPQHCVHYCNNSKMDTAKYLW